MRKAGLGRGPAVPFFGDFNEVNVRLYSREPGGSRGVVFLSLDADRLAVVLAARAAGIPYVWSGTGFHYTPADSSIGYSVRRFRGGARSEFAAVPEWERIATDPLSVHLTARFGLHTSFRGRTIYVPKHALGMAPSPGRADHARRRTRQCGRDQGGGSPGVGAFFPGSPDSVRPAEGPWYLVSRLFTGGQHH